VVQVIILDRKETLDHVASLGRWRKPKGAGALEPRAFSAATRSARRQHWVKFGPGKNTELGWFELARRG
jgi:hypothetical protein